jgi:hypothetical protein
LPPAGAQINARAKDRILYRECYASAPASAQKKKRGA